MTSQNQNNLKKGQQVAFISVFISFVLAILKGVVGVLFNSQVLIADAVHSCADLMTHAASGFGLWLAARGKTEKFPYGLYRAETFSCLVVGVLIILAGIGLFQEGIHKLFHLEEVNQFPVFPIGASLISCIAGFVIATMESKVGKEIGSKSLIASSKEAYMDIFTSLVVLGGIVLAYFQVPYAEGVIIILISCLLLKIGIENGWGALLILLDADLEPELKSDIATALAQVKGVESVEEVKIRQSGPFKMVECIIKTKPELTLYKAHEVADRAEEVVAQNFKHIESTFIHVEPGKKDTLLAMIPVADTDGLSAKVHNHFARAPYYLLVKLAGESCEIIAFEENIHLTTTEHIGVKTSRLAIDNQIDILFTASIGEISYHILHSNMIEVYQLPSSLCAQQVIEGYYQGKFEQLKQPSHPIEESQKHLQQHLYISGGQ